MVNIIPSKQSRDIKKLELFMVNERSINRKAISGGVVICIIEN